MATSNTQRTIRELKNLGRKCGITERWISCVGPHGIRQDLFGFIDVIALDPARGIIAIQSCGQDVAAHVGKITNSDCTENVMDWIQAGGKVEVWGWRKVKVKRGGKAERWRPRVIEITLDDIVRC